MAEEEEEEEKENTLQEERTNLWKIEKAFIIRLSVSAVLFKDDLKWTVVT